MESIDHADKHSPTQYADPLHFCAYRYTSAPSFNRSLPRMYDASHFGDTFRLQRTVKNLVWLALFQAYQKQEEI